MEAAKLHPLWAVAVAVGKVQVGLALEPPSTHAACSPSSSDRLV